MARVPTYQQQVENTPLVGSRFSANATAASFGGADAAIAAGIGQGLAGVANALADKAQKNQKIKDVAVARDASNSFDSDVRNLEADYYARSGKSALEMHKEAETKIQEARRKHMDSLQSEEQKAHFTAWADAESKRFLDSVMTKQIKETESFHETTLKAQNASLTDNSVGNRTLPAQIAENDSLMQANLRSSKAFRDADPATQELMLKKATNDHYSAVLHAVDADSSQAGKDFLEKNKDKFLATEYTTLMEEQKKKASGEYVAQRAKDLSNSGVALEVQLAAADQEKDPVIGEKIRTQLLERAKNKETIKDYQSKTEVASELNRYYANPEAYSAAGGYKGANEDVRKALKTAYENITEGARRKVLGAGNAPAVDWAAYNDLAIRIAKGENPDLNAYSGRLDPSQHQRLNDMMLGRLQTQTAAQKEEFARKWQLDQRINDAVKDLPKKHFDTETGGEEARLRKSALIEQMYSELNSLPKEKQTPEVVDAMLKEMTNKVITKNWLVFNKENYRFEADKLPADQQLRYFVQNPPETLKGQAGVQWDSGKGMYFKVTGSTAFYFDKFGKPVAKADLTGKKAPQGVRVEGSTNGGK
jgi:hypothetical protein